MHLRSLSTREDVSSLPTTETMFSGSKTDMLGQLVVTTEVATSTEHYVRK